MLRRFAKLGLALLPVLMAGVLYGASAIYHPPAGVIVLDSGITGTVVLGPTCPIPAEMVPPSPSCADKPYKTALQLVLSGNADTAIDFSSDQNGHFKVTAAPGTYSISSTNSGKLPSCTDTTPVVVTAHSFTTAAVFCDTGIR